MGKSKEGRLFLRYLRYIRVTDRHILLCIAFIFSLSYVSVSYGEIVSVLWNPSREPNVAGYKVYYGNSSRNYDHVIDVGNFTNYELYIPSKETYYVALTAYDAAGNESGFSAEVIVEQGVRLEIVDAFVGLNSRREERFKPGDKIFYHIYYRLIGESGKAYMVKGIVKAFGRRLISKQKTYPGYYYPITLTDTIPHTAGGGGYTIEYRIKLNDGDVVLANATATSQVNVVGPEIEITNVYASDSSKLQQTRFKSGDGIFYHIFYRVVDVNLDNTYYIKGMVKNKKFNKVRGLKPNTWVFPQDPYPLWQHVPHGSAYRIIIEDSVPNLAEPGQYWVKSKVNMKKKGEVVDTDEEWFSFYVTE